MQKLSELVHTLLSEVDEHENRIGEEKKELEKKLTNDIAKFQA